jgi:hypothetical protein
MLFFGWIAALVRCMGSAGEAVAFLLVSHAVGGIIHGRA